MSFSMKALEPQAFRVLLLRSMSLSFMVMLMVTVLSRKMISRRYLMISWANPTYSSLRKMLI